MKNENPQGLLSRKSAVIALVLVAGAVLFGVVRNSHGPITTPFPQKSSVHVSLKPAKVSEDIRYTTYWPDGKTPMNERIERKNGETVYTIYSHTGTKSEQKEFYPAPKKPGDKPAVDDDGTPVFPSSQPYEFSTAGRQLKSLIVFSVDGKEVMATERYRADGTREVVGKRLPEGSFQNLVFHKDGQTLSFSQLFARNGDLLTEQQFAEGGSRLIGSTTREADGFLHSKTFREDGTLLSMGILAQYRQIITFYQADGVKRRMLVVNTASSVSVVYFREDGEAISQREWTSYGGMTVTELVPGSGYYDESGVQVKSYTTRNKSSWKLIPADTATKTPEHYVLTELLVTDAKGETLRKFIFDDKTGAVTRIWMYNDGKNTHDRMYNPDGTLKEVGWVGSDDFSKAYNAQHKGDADRQPGAKLDPADAELIKRYSKDIQFEDPRPLLSKVAAEPQQYMGEMD